MKRTLLLTAALFAFAASLNATAVDQDAARRVATHFWNTYRPTELKSAGNVIEVSFPELSHLHIFSIDGTGFVIVSGDDRVTPVLGYSFHNLFPAELNPEVGYWLDGYEQQLAYVAKSDLVATEKVANQWKSLLSEEGVPDTPIDLTDIPALLSTEWDQGDPYNRYCPFDSTRNNRTVVGCVATAMAQIMKYWDYPSFGEGSHSYVHRYWLDETSLGTISADFGSTTYLWQYMPNTLLSFSPEHQRKAVGILSFHCGVAVDMMYGTSAQGGSGAYSSCNDWISQCATNAFWQYFKYDTTLFYAERDDHSDSSWTALIDTQLAQRHPIYYDGSDHSGGGHAFVLDGSDLEGRYHFNWGWSGYGNGFYTIDNLAPGSGGAGSNSTHSYNEGQGAIFGIKPAFVETFDTVDYYDSICDNSQYVDFHEYHLRAVAMDTLLRHLDTVFRYHLKIISKKRALLEPHCDGEDTKTITFCPATGFNFPEAPCTDGQRIFIGWCRSLTGDDVIYQPGEHVTFNANRTYHALWVSTNVGIDSPESSELALWPNPTTGEITLAVPAETGTIIVTDVLGRVVLRNDNPNIMGGHVKISLSALANGIYNIQVKCSEGILKQRIIKQ